MNRINPFTVGFLIFAFAFILYLPSLVNGFFWDDYYGIINNPALRNVQNIPRILYDASYHMLDPEAKIYRPLRTIVYLGLFQTFGLRPEYFHLVNVFFHALNASLVFFLILLHTKTRLTALIAGILFATHPVLTEAVAWIKGMDDVIALSFALLALLITIQTGRRNLSFKRILSISLLYLIALGFKISVIIVPLLMVSYWWISEFKIRMDRSRKITVCAMIIISLFYLVARHLSMGQSHQVGYLGGTPWNTWARMAPVMLLYLKRALFPDPLIADYAHFAQGNAFSLVDLILSATALILIICVSLLIFLKRNSISFYISWWWIALLPVSNIVPMMQYMAERFLYIPLVGFCGVVGIVFQAALRHSRKGIRTITLTVLCILMVILTSITRHRMGVWGDPEALFESILTVAPDNLRAKKNLAYTYFGSNQYSRACSLYKELHASNVISSGIVLQQIGACYLRMGAEQEGWRYLELSKKENPNNPALHVLRGRKFGLDGNESKAVEEFRSGLDINPDHPGLLNSMGIHLWNKGRMKEAEFYFRRSLRSNPHNYEAGIYLGALLWKNARFDEACSLYKELHKEFPTDNSIYHLGEAACRRSH